MTAFGGSDGWPGLSAFPLSVRHANRGCPTVCGEARRWFLSFGANGGIRRTVPLIPPFRLGPRVTTPRRAQQLSSLTATGRDEVKVTTAVNPALPL